MPNLSGVAGPSPLDVRDYPPAAISTKLPILPSSVRMDHEINIRDQGFWGTCVGKAGAELMSAKLGKKISSLFLYTRCKQLDGIPNEQGTYVRTALRVMQKDGVCLDRSLPYDKLKNHDHLPALTVDMCNEASYYKIQAYARADNIRDIKEALANGHLVIAVILVGDNFIYYKGGVMGEAAGTLSGYHAVIICGYDDIMQAVGGRGANSWNTSWGEDGFFWLSYTAFNSPTMVEAWIVEIEKKSTEDFYPDRIFRELRRYLKKLIEGGDKIMLKTMWKKEQFWLILVGAILAILNDVLGFGVNSEAVWTVVGLFLGWLIKEGIVEASVKAAMIREVGYVTAVKQLEDK